MATITDPRDIILAPVISEKSYGLIEDNTYTFVVHPDSNKTQIKIAIEKIFSVKVDSVNTLNRQGKRKRTRAGFGQRRAPSARSSPWLRAASRSTCSEHRLTAGGSTEDNTDMPLRKYKPTTPGRRGSSVSRLRRGHSVDAEKSLVRPLHSTGGRNAHGRITTRHKGGGHKRAYRVIDFRRHDKDGVDAKVAHIEYDPNRTANIALLHYVDGEKRYIIAPQGLSQGDRIEQGPNADIKPGNNLPLRNIPSGTVIHAVELRPGVAQRWAAPPVSAFSCSAKEGTYATLRMPSGEIRRVDVRCRATVGEVGNAEQGNINWGRPAGCGGRASAPPSVVS